MTQRISLVIPPDSGRFDHHRRFRFGNVNDGSDGAVIQVPASLVVTATAYRKFMDKYRLDEVVEGLLEGVNVRRIEEILGPAAQIKQIIHSAPIPEPLYSFLSQGYRGLGDGAKFIWPVTMPGELLDGATNYPDRARTTAADLPEMIKTIKTWWASLFDATAIFYRELNGQSHRDARIILAVSTDWPREHPILPGQGDFSAARETS